MRKKEKSKRERKKREKRETIITGERCEGQAMKGMPTE